MWDADHFYQLFGLNFRTILTSPTQCEGKIIVKSNNQNKLSVAHDSCEMTNMNNSTGFTLLSDKFGLSKWGRPHDK